VKQPCENSSEVVTNKKATCERHSDRRQLKKGRVKEGLRLAGKQAARSHIALLGSQKKINLLMKEAKELKTKILS
jgi:hypothetical protein